MTRTILVTGAGGFVGSHLAEGLLSLGHEITALDRNFDEATRTRLWGARVVETNLNKAELFGLDQRFDAIVHAAALTSTPAEMGISDLAHIRINVDLLVDCLDFADAENVGQVFFLSSSGVFATGDGDPHLESTVPSSATPYAVAKRMGELLCTAKPFALAARLGPIYGPHETARRTRQTVSPVRRWLDAARAGQPLVVDNPGSRRDWTFAPDLARALDALLDGGRPVQGIMHLTSGEAISDLCLAKTIAERHGARIETRAGTQTPRVPMISERRELADFAWTPLMQGLSLTQEAAR